MRFLTEAGDEEISNAIVFVDRVMQVGGWLLEDATVAELDSAYLDSPETCSGAYRIRAFDEIPDLNNQSVLKKAIL